MRRRHLLINEHNRLKFAVKEKEIKLIQLQEMLDTAKLKTTTYNNEDAECQVSVLLRRRIMNTPQTTTPTRGNAMVV